jgi:hypothetical protein
MKSVRFVCFVLPAVLGCSSGPVDLGDPGRDDAPHGNDDPGTKGNGDLPGDKQQEPGPQNPAPSLPSNAPETVLESAALADVGEIRTFDLAAGKLYYSALHDDHMSLFRYDITSKANALVDRDYGGSPFAADAGGLFYYGLTADPVRKAVIGMPLTTTTHAPEWFAGVTTHATAIALDQQKVYFVERGELHTFFRIANRGTFMRPPTETGAFGPSVTNNSEFFNHLVIDQGLGYAAGDRGRLVKFDLEIATTLLTSGGPKNGFVVDSSSFYWVDGTDLKALSKSAAPGTTPSVIATLPSGANNLLGGVGPKGIYILSQPSADPEAGKVLRIHPTTGAPTELATQLSELRGGTFLDKALYFATSKGVFRLTDG